MPFLGVVFYHHPKILGFHTISCPLLFLHQHHCTGEPKAMSTMAATSLFRDCVTKTHSQKSHCLSHILSFKTTYLQARTMKRSGNRKAMEGNVVGHSWLVIVIQSLLFLLLRGSTFHKITDHCVQFIHFNNS